MGHQLRICLVVIALGSSSAQAGSHSIMSVHGRPGHSGNGYSPIPRGYGGYGGYGGYYGGSYIVGYPVYVPYPVVPYYYPMNPGSMAMGPAPMAAMTPTRNSPMTTSRTRRPDTAFGAEMMTIGDRLFRAGNFTKAVERYEQSIKADPAKAAPRVRLAQVAMVRGQYQEAARWLREADTVEPTYLVNATDIRALYLEPGDFTRQLSRLESHLQTHPEDRDGWLVLGAEHYLSGRTRQAADIFLRLTDRQADPTLSAFLSATKARDEP